MTDLVSFIVAEGVAIDQITSRVTVFNIIDHALVSAVPSMMTRLTAVSQYRLSGQAKAFVERVRVLSPDGVELIASHSRVVMVPRTQHQLPNAHRSIHVLWSVKLPAAGDYSIVLERQPITELVDPSAGWELLASQMMTVLEQPNFMLNSGPASGPPPSQGRTGSQG